jgi:hypothetical protein
VVWGSNLSSTVGLKFIQIYRSTLSLPPYIFSVVFGLLLGDAWVCFGGKTAVKARLGLVMTVTSHSFGISLLFYPTIVPVSLIQPQVPFGEAALDFLVHFTRSLPCFTDLRSLLYIGSIKIVPIYGI